MSRTLTKLDEFQQVAVDSDSKRLVVVAPAGSGKTRVMVERVSKLLKDGVPESRILPITFTRKAAQELTERIRKEAGAFIRAYTIHSFAYNLILHHYAPRIGYRRPVSIYDEHLSAEIYADIMIALGVKKENFRHNNARWIHKAFRELELKDEDAWIKTDEMYQKRLKAFNAVDYDLMIRLAVRLLRESEFARLSIHNQFQHLLIDEFQDTDIYQMEMVDLIDPMNLFVVGDYDQSIYAFRGAHPENMVTVAKSSHVVNLSTNYRSCERIIEISNELITHNKSELRKPAEPCWSAEKGRVIIKNVLSPADNTAETVKELLQRFKPNEISVLCRTNRLVQEISASLDYLKIPHVAISRERDFWEMPMVRGIIYTLMFLQNPSDIASWSKAIDFPDKKLTPELRAEIKKIAVTERKKILEATIAIDEGDVSEWAEIIKMIREECERTEDWNAREVLTLCDGLFGWQNYFNRLTPGARGQTGFKFAIDRINLQLDELKRGGFPELENFLEWYAGRELQDAIQKDLPLVQISTIHAFKGLENEVIVLPDWTHGTFPNMKGDIEEERRLAYVALTRAKQELHIIYRDDPSLFINEFGNEPEEDDDENFIK